MLADGARIDPVRKGNGYAFRLPAAAELRLVSRRAIPAQVMAESEDHRPLGVAVARLVADGRRLALDGAAFGAGWHAVEPDWRWSDGDAVLLCPGARRLEVQVLPMLGYWDDAARIRRRRARAG